MDAPLVFPRQKEHVGVEVDVDVDVVVDARVADVVVELEPELGRGARLFARRRRGLWSRSPSLVGCAFVNAGGAAAEVTEVAGQV